MNERELPVQPEGTPVTRDQPDTFTTLFAHHDRRHCATSLDRQGIGIGAFSHGPNPTDRGIPIRRHRSKRADVGKEPVPEPDNQSGAAPSRDVAKDLPEITHDPTSSV